MVKLKKVEHRTKDGLPVRSWSCLMESLGTLCRNTCWIKDDPAGPSFVVETDANELLKRVFQLLKRAQYYKTPN
jgi:hypothetical protein